MNLPLTRSKRLCLEGKTPLDTFSALLVSSSFSLPPPPARPSPVLPPLMSRYFSPPQLRADAEPPLRRCLTPPLMTPVTSTKEIVYKWQFFFNPIYKGLPMILFIFFFQIYHFAISRNTCDSHPSIGIRFIIKYMRTEIFKCFAMIDETNLFVVRIHRITFPEAFKNSWCKDTYTIAYYCVH